MPNSTAILLAGGSGNRMAGQVEDKILADLAGKPLIAHSIAAFVSSSQVQQIVIVTRDDAQRAAIEAAIKVASPVPSGQDPASKTEAPQPKTQNPQPQITFARGGAQRQDSVWAGLQAAPANTEIVLIHDCARPCITPEAIRESIAKASEIGAACLARPVSDTLKSASPASTASDSTPSGFSPQPSAFHTTTVDRSTLWAMETPQTFQFPIIHRAYQSIIETGTPITDDLSAIEDIDQPVAFIDNARPNPKLTSPSDLPYLAYLLSETKTLRSS